MGVVDFCGVAGVGGLVGGLMGWWLGVVDVCGVARGWWVG